MSNTVVKVENVSKEYKLGAIGGGTLRGDLQSLMARVRGKEDPNSKVGQQVYTGSTRFKALNDVSFEVRQGDTLGVIGHNGAGKSTLLKLMSRVTAPSTGTIKLNGRIASMLEVGTGFHPELTGRENVYLNGAILGMTKAEVKRKFDEIVTFAEMEKFIDTPVKRYSSGMYVRLAFAVAAHLDSEILVMDEVLAVGDMKFQEKCLGKMGDVADKEGRTVIYVSHSMNTIRQLCNRCILLDHGEVKHDGDVDTAVNMYMHAVSDFRGYVEYPLNPRREKYNKKVQLNYMRYLDGDSIMIDEQSPIAHFALGYETHKKVDDVNFQFEIAYADGTPAGTAMNGQKVNFEANEKGELAIDLNFSHIAPGNYKAVLIAYETNSFGTPMAIDRVEAFNFKILRNDKSTYPIWDHVNFGHSHYDDFDIRKI